MEFSQNCTDDIPLPSYDQLMEALGDFGTAMVIAGSVITGLIIAVYVFHVYRLTKRSPRNRWLKLAWIISLPAVFSFLSLVALVVPSSFLLCDTIKLTYFPYLLVQFIDLSLGMEGGQSKIVKNLETDGIVANLCLPFCCCFGLCFRHLSYNRERFRFFKGLIYQNPVVQLIIMSSFIVFENAGIMERDFSDPLYAAITVIYYLAFGFGVWGFYVLTAALGERSNWNRYRAKALIVGVSVVLLKGQNGLFVILESTDVIPCIPPYTSSIALRTTFEAVCSLLAAPIYCLLFFLIYQESTLDAQSEVTFINSRPS